MKTIFTTILLLFSHILLSQESKTPYFLIQNNDTIGVVLSLDQAQKIDSNLEMLNLLEELQIDCENLDNSYVKVINALGEKVTTLEFKANDLTSQVGKKDDEIRNLKLSNLSLDSACTTCEELVSVKDSEITELKKEVRRQKFKKLISVGSNVGLVVTIFFLLKM